MNTDNQTGLTQSRRGTERDYQSWKCPNCGRVSKVFDPLMPKDRAKLNKVCITFICCWWCNHSEPAPLPRLCGSA